MNWVIGKNSVCLETVVQLWLNKNCGGKNKCKLHNIKRQKCNHYSCYLFWTGNLTIFGDSGSVCGLQQQCHPAPTIFLRAPRVPLMGFVPASDTPADPDQKSRQKMWPSSVVWGVNLPSVLFENAFFRHFPHYCFVFPYWCWGCILPAYLSL